MAQRSTKGASKQRRDAINRMISQIRELLPVAESVRCRLSQLQVMAFVKAYINKTNFFGDYCLDADDYSTLLNDNFDFTQSLPGFLLITNVDGHILYISDNVTEILGNSAVDSVTQLESIYDMIDERDRDVLRQAMNAHQQQQQQSTGTSSWCYRQHPNTAFSFTCRLTTSSRTSQLSTCFNSRTANGRSAFEKQKTVQMTGRFLCPRSLSHGTRLSYSNPHLQTVFAALCTPHVQTSSSSSTPTGYGSSSSSDVVETDTMTFQSVHGRDMKYIRVESNGEFHLGYENCSIKDKSWYGMIHPDDINEAASKHIKLMESLEIGDMTSSQTTCLRFQTRFGQFIWVQVWMRLYAGQQQAAGLANRGGAEPLVICTNHVIDQPTAAYLTRQQAESDELQAALQQQQRLPFEMSTASVFPPSNIKTLPLPVVTSPNEVSERLKRKIIRRHDDTMMMAKIPRMCEEKNDDMDSFLSSLMSVPTPPSQQNDEFYQQQRQQGDMIDECRGVDGAVTYGDNYQTSLIPVSVDEMSSVLLTPTSSPGCEHLLATNDEYFGYGASPISQDDNDCSFFTQQFKQDKPIDSLPVLDATSIASVLENATTADLPVVAMTTPYRHQLSGGHVTVTEATAVDAERRRQPVLDECDQQLIGSLLNMGDRFVENCWQRGLEAGAAAGVWCNNLPPLDAYYNDNGGQELWTDNASFTGQSCIYGY